MAEQIKLLAFSGSLRADSLNKKLVKVAATGAEEAGAEVTVLDIKDYPMPQYDDDWFTENGFPESVLTLKAMCKASHGFLIASPEYNGSVTGALKNLIDWLSRPEPDEAPLACFKGKTAGIMATSPGGLGGLRGLRHLREILEGIGVLVIPNQKAVPNAYQMFDDADQMTDADQRASIEAIGARVATVAAKLN